MRFLSLFSGIEACSVAWGSLGWHCVGFSEIEPFPCALLTHHYPNVVNLGDITKITEQQIIDLGRIDLVVFGSPCQDLSVAGKRKGFTENTRSNLFFEALRIFDYARKHCNARFALWENVPGAFISNKGADFATVVREMAGLPDATTPVSGWGNSGAALGEAGLLEWGILDAQYFGLAQRRKRLFALLDTGNWYDRPPVLLEPESMRGYFAPKYSQNENTTECDSQSTSECYQMTYAFLECADGIYANDKVFPTLVSSGYKRQIGIIAGNIINRSAKNGGNQLGVYVGDVSPTLTTRDIHAVVDNLTVRRLTVTECERLMGFPDGYTDILFNGNPASKTARYKALGNSMAVNVMRYIGKKLIDSLQVSIQDKQ